MVMGSDYEQMVDRISEMGFPKDQVRLALQASFNNPDRAVEYLMTGIPAQAAPAPAAAQPAAPTPAAPAAAQPARPSGNLFQQAAEMQQQQSSAANNVFDQLRNLPNFDSIRLLVQQHPQFLQQVLQQLSQSNPQMFQLITQNQQEFIRLLNEPVPPDTPLLPIPGMGGAQAPPPGVIQVTPEEKAAIERLEAMGFEKSKAAEAFFACDKDENLAANYLLEHGFDDDDGDDQ